MRINTELKRTRSTQKIETNRENTPQVKKGRGEGDFQRLPNLQRIFQKGHDLDYIFEKVQVLQILSIWSFPAITDSRRWFFTPLFLMTKMPPFSFFSPSYSSSFPAKINLQDKIVSAPESKKLRLSSLFERVPSLN